MWKRQMSTSLSKIIKETFENLQASTIQLEISEFSRADILKNTQGEMLLLLCVIISWLIYQIIIYLH